MIELRSPRMTGTLAKGPSFQPPAVPYEWRKKTYPQAAAAVAATMAEHGISPGKAGTKPGRYAGKVARRQ